MLRVYYCDSGKHSDKEVQAFSRIWSFLEEKFGDSDIDIRLLLWPWVFREVHQSSKSEHDSVRSEPGKKPPTDAVEFDYLILAPNLLAVGEYKNFYGANLDGSENEAWTLFDEEKNKKVLINRGSKHNKNPYHQLSKNRRGFSGSILQLCKKFNSWTGLNLMHSINMLLTFKGPILDRSKRISRLLDKDLTFQILDLASGDLDNLAYLIRNNKLPSFKKPLNSTQLDSIISMLGFDPKKPENISQLTVTEANKQHDLYLRRLQQDHQYVKETNLFSRLTDDDLSIDLEDIYIDQKFTLLPNKAYPTLGNKTTSLPRRRIGLAMNRSLDNILTQSRLLVIGDPGAGKTTLCRALLRNILRSDGVSKKEFLKGKVPVFIKAQDFALFLEKNESGTLSDYILNLFNFKFETMFLYYINNGELFLILDGLDEIVDPVLTSRACALVNDFTNEFDSIQILCTSREVGFRELDLSDDFKTYLLQPFTDSQVKKFLRKWYDSIESRSLIITDKEKKESVNKLLESIKINSAVKELAHNPLLLTMLTTLYWEKGSLPRNKLEIYKLSIELLLEKWPFKTRRMHLKKNELLPFLEQVAYRIFDSGKDNIITRPEVEMILIDGLRKGLKYTYAQSRNLADELLTIIEKYTGFLIVRGLAEDRTELYGFIHRSFMEYLTGRHLAHLWNNGKIDLGKHISERKWSDALMFMMEYINTWDDIKINKLYFDILKTKTETTEFLHDNIRFIVKSLKIEMNLSKAVQMAIIPEIFKITFETELESIYAEMVAGLSNLGLNTEIKDLLKNFKPQSEIQNFKHVVLSQHFGAGKDKIHVLESLTKHPELYQLFLKGSFWRFGLFKYLTQDKNIFPGLFIIRNKGKQINFYIDIMFLRQLDVNLKPFPFEDLLKGFLGRETGFFIFRVDNLKKLAPEKLYKLMVKLSDPALLPNLFIRNGCFEEVYEKLFRAIEQKKFSLVHLKLLSMLDFDIPGSVEKMGNFRDKSFIVLTRLYFRTRKYELKKEILNSLDRVFRYRKSYSPELIIRFLKEKNTRLLQRFLLIMYRMNIFLITDVKLHLQKLLNSRSIKTRNLAAGIFLRSVKFKYLDINSILNKGFTGLEKIKKVETDVLSDLIRIWRKVPSKKMRSKILKIIKNLAKSIFDFKKEPYMIMFSTTQRFTKDKQLKELVRILIKSKKENVHEIGLRLSLKNFPEDWTIHKVIKLIKPLDNRTIIVIRSLPKEMLMAQPIRELLFKALMNQGTKIRSRLIFYLGRIKEKEYRQLLRQQCLYHLRKKPNKYILALLDRLR